MNRPTSMLLVALSLLAPLASRAATAPVQSPQQDQQSSQPTGDLVIESFTVSGTRPIATRGPTFLADKPVTFSVRVANRGNGPAFGRDVKLYGESFDKPCHDPQAMWGGTAFEYPIATSINAGQSKTFSFALKQYPWEGDEGHCEVTVDFVPIMKRGLENAPAKTLQFTLIRQPGGARP